MVKLAKLALIFSLALSSLAANAGVTCSGKVLEVVKWSGTENQGYFKVID